VGSGHKWSLVQGISDLSFLNGALRLVMPPCLAITIFWLIHPLPASQGSLSTHQTFGEIGLKQSPCYCHLIICITVT
jgi:F0F1-type ATP synthase assembly protein I